MHTGHVSPAETLLVLEQAEERGMQCVAVTHAMAEVPGLSLEQMKQAAGLGAYLELALLNHLRGRHAHLPATLLGLEG